MKTVSILRATLALAALFLGSYPAPATAEIVKPLRLTSVPSGAEVYLLEGRKETLLGKTPVTYEATFHSEMSIVRLVFKKTGYGELRLKVSATQDEAVARLTALELGARPEYYTDQNLRALQERLNPLLNESLLALLEKEGAFSFDLASPVSLASVGEQTYLVLSLALRPAKKRLRLEGPEERKTVLKAIWAQLGTDVVSPLAETMRTISGIHGVALDVILRKATIKFGVLPESHVEMECVAGTKTVYKYFHCAHRGPKGECFGGQVPMMERDPCMTRIPKVKIDMKVAPGSLQLSGQPRALFVAPTEVVSGGGAPEQAYDRLSLALFDGDEKIQMSQGDIEHLCHPAGAASQSCLLLKRVPFPESPTEK